MAPIFRSISTLAVLAALARPGATAAQQRILLADPTIFADDGTYYLYGTGSPQGFPAFTSSDLQHWRPVTDTLALRRGGAFGGGGFWAPQVFKRGNTYYMAYTADEQIAIATASSPAGPFRQHIPRRLSGSGKQIDPFVYFDDSGKVYLYHVKLQQGNRIFVSEMKPDLTDVIPGTEKECIASTAGWENTANAEWPVAEGPTVIKHKNLYYLIYSANDFRNRDYAVGYATSPSPTGPWKKYEGNPIISRHQVKQNGPGHGDVLVDNGGRMYYVLHLHHSDTRVSPRATAIVPLRFREGKDGEDVLEADIPALRPLVQ